MSPIEGMSHVSYIGVMSGKNPSVRGSSGITFWCMLLGFRCEGVACMIRCIYTWHATYDLSDYLHRCNLAHDTMYLHMARYIGVRV
jgi:hypothetical protein